MINLAKSVLGTETAKVMGAHMEIRGVLYRDREENQGPAHHV